MADKTRDAATAEATRVIQETKAADPTQAARKVGQADSATAAPKPGEATNTLTADAVAPTGKATPSKAVNVLSALVSDLETGEKHIDKMIKGGLNGNRLSQEDLLRMQAAMYKYTQELELTGKVVEKATSGLKDTLKTQV
jgi:hypothetical protein